MAALCALAVLAAAAQQAAGARLERITNTVTALATHGPRLAGYAGDRFAANLIEQELRAAGVRDISREPFHVVVPMDHGARLELDGGERQLQLTALWPNLVRTSSTPRGGIAGQLFYAGDGEAQDFDGHELEGSIVLLEFNTWSNWVTAASLGARAIVFIAPQQTTIFEAREKWNWAPLDVPRFWLERKAGLALRKELGDGSRRARVVARMEWEERESWNIWGVIPGTDPALRDQLWAVQAYYDGISVAPALTPAAESAAGAAALIELAHYLRTHPPGRSVALIVTGGHFLNQAGLKAFLNQHARQREPFRRRMPQRFVADSLDVERLVANARQRRMPLDSLGIGLRDDPATGRTVLDSVNIQRLTARLKLMQLLDTPDSLGIKLEPDSLAIELFVSLDLSTQSDRLGIWHNTSTQEYRRFYVPIGRSFVRHAANVAPDLGLEPEKALANGISPIKGMEWSSYVDDSVVIADGALAQGAGQMAISLMTVNDARLAVDTPLDTPDGVSFRNLHTQCGLLERVLHAALGDSLVFGPEAAKLRSKHKENIKDQLVGIRGALRLLPRKSTTPNRPVPHGLVALQPSFRDDPWRPAIHIADADGEYEVSGLQPGRVELQAFVLDESDGSITYATDLGERAQAFGKYVHSLSKAETQWTTILFPAAKLEVYDRVHSQFLFTLGHNPGALKILDKRGATPQQFGCVLGDWASTVLVLFGSHEDSLRLIDQSVFLLNNAGATTEKEAQGRGYSLATMSRVPHGTLEYARNLWTLNEVRNERLRRFAIENPRVQDRHERAGWLIEQAKDAIAALEWSRYARHAREALGIEYQAYHDVRGTQDDVIGGLVFFVALMVPAAFFAERLLFAAPDVRKQLLLFGVILLLIWAVLSQVHPAFELAHPVIILLALMIAIMALFVIALVASRFNSFMTALRQRSSGTMASDISRSGTSYVAFMLGISNMRRRPMRTVLTLATITILTFTVLSFTSFKPSISFVGFEKDWEPPYVGALLHDVQWWPWEYSVLDYVQSHFAAYGTVVPRTWLAQGLQQEGQIPITLDSRSTDALSLLGFTPDETRVTGIDRSLVAGSWFTAPDERSIILPQAMARQLGISPGSVGSARVQALGATWTVRGIFDAQHFEQIRDLNNEPLTPAKQKTDSVFMPGMQQLFASASRYVNFDLELGFEHLDASRVAILPYDLLASMDAPLYSVAVRFNEDVDGEKLVQQFLTRTGFRFFVGLPDPQGGLRALAYTSLGVTSMEGLGALLIPMLIAGLIVLNTMMGAVYERFREIGVYSSVGLAPVHIAFLFMAESCVYGVLGVTIGYVFGQVIAKLLIAAGLLGGVSLNYSSTAAIASAVLVMAVVLLSTLYPARAASRLAVPDVVRRWQLPDPEGDVWRFIFPFTVNRNSVESLCGYLYTFFRAYGHESVGKLYTEKTRIVVQQGEKGNEYGVQLLVWLAPFDMGVSQYLQFTIRPTTVANISEIELYIERISGPVAFWQRLNLSFMLELRKQFLIWQTLKDDLHQDHAETTRRVSMNASRIYDTVEAE